MLAVIEYLFYPALMISVHSCISAESFPGFSEFFDHAFINTETLSVGISGNNIQTLLP